MTDAREQEHGGTESTDRRQPGGAGENVPGVYPDVVRWLAWVADDSDRDEAVEYKRPVHRPDADRLELEAEEIAAHYAEISYDDSAGEIGLQFVVSVIAVHEDETENAFQIDIFVEFSPTFSAYARERPTATRPTQED